MRLVIIESPYAGATPEDVAINVAYARACLLNSLLKGEAPIASHLLYTQVLDDKIPEQRKMGIDAGLAWRKVFAVQSVRVDARSAETPWVERDIYARVLPVFYVDLGWSRGMEAAQVMYRAEGIAYEERTIGPCPPPARLIEGGRGLEREGGEEP
jgi:hypothetical protein